MVTRRTRTVARLGAVLLLAAVVAACGGRGSAGGGGDGGDGEKLTIRVAHELTPQSVKGLTLQKFKELVEAKAGDRVAVEVYPNSELYGGAEAIEAVQNGSVEMTIGATGDFVNIAPSLQVMDLPFVVEDYDEVPGLTAPGTPVGDLIRENPDLQKNNVKVLTVVGSGIKQVSSNKRIATMADLSGQRIRTQQSPAEMRIFEGLGAAPVPMEDFSQVYTALEQGVVDGQTNPYSTIASESVYEVQRYIAEVNMGYTSYLVIIGSDYWDTLPADVQADLEAAATETQKYSLQLQRDENAAAKQTIAESGTEIVPFDDAERAKLKQALIPGVYESFSDVIGPEIVRSLIEKEQAEMR